MSHTEDRLALIDFLPDSERTRNPWSQVFRDLVAPAPVSHWAKLTTTTRIYRYDRIRPYLTRGTLLVILAVLLALASGTQPLMWPLLLVGAVQTVLEIHLDFQLNRGGTSRFMVFQWMLTWLEEKQWEQTLVNATGLLGTAAVPLNLACVLYLTGPGEPAPATDRPVRCGRTDQCPRRGRPPRFLAVTPEDHGPVETAGSYAGDRVTWLRSVLAAILLTGVTCQFVQHTDLKFPLLYFTIDSALLEAVVMLWLLLSARAFGAWLNKVHGAAVIGVVMSALVYATVIAPASPTGTWFAPHDDVWVRTATVLLHGVAPFLAVLEYLLTPSVPGRRALSFTWWPITYLVVIGCLAWAGVIIMPYPFLRPSVYGPGVTALAIATLFAVVIALGLALQKLHRLIERPRCSEPTQTALLSER